MTWPTDPGETKNLAAKHSSRARADQDNDSDRTDPQTHDRTQRPCTCPAQLLTCCRRDTIGSVADFRSTARQPPGPLESGLQLVVDIRSRVERQPATQSSESHPVDNRGTAGPNACTGTDRGCPTTADTSSQAVMIQRFPAAFRQATYGDDRRLLVGLAAG